MQDKRAKVISMGEKRQAAGEKQNNYVKNIKDEQERYIWEQLSPQKIS